MNKNEYSLTQKQIEKEDWVHLVNNEYRKDNLHLKVFIGYHYQEIISIVISIYSCFGVKFYGDCKNIKEFRLINSLIDHE